MLIKQMHQNNVICVTNGILKILVLMMLQLIMLREALAHVPKVMQLA